MASTRHPHRTSLLFGPILALAIAAAPVSAATGWTGPRTIGSWEGCSGVTAAIDGTGRFHVVASCFGTVRYASGDGERWSLRAFVHPADHPDIDPQIAIDGDRVYVAFSRETPGTCGTSYVGVFYRWRTLPDGKWSPATRVGEPGDNLQSFRVVNRTLHLTVGAQETWYEIYETGTLARYRLADTVIGSSSLRINHDGTARIVYQDGRALRYARFNGSGFDTSTIPGTNSYDRDPVLVLDGWGHAYVAWSHIGGQSCGDEGPDTVGTYYATNKSGTWTPRASRRVTGDLGSHSLTVDTRTQRVHLLVAGDFGVKYFTKTPTGAWHGLRLSSSPAYGGAAIRLDQETDTLLAVYNGTSASEDVAHLLYLTRP